MSFPTFPEPTSDAIFLIVGLIAFAPFLLYALGAVVYTGVKHRQGLSKQEADKLPNPFSAVTTGLLVAAISTMVSLVIVMEVDRTAYENYKETVTKTLSEDYGVELQGQSSLYDFTRGKIVRAEYADGEKVVIALLDGKAENPRVVQADDRPLPLLTASTGPEDEPAEGEASSEPPKSSAPTPEPSPSLTAAPLPDRPLGSVLESDGSSLQTP